MNNQIQISLAFTADTKQAQMQLQNLQNSLKTLMTASPNLFPDSSIEQVRKAQSAVASLSVALKNATNVDTGKLNLTQFNESLNRSGMSLEQYRKQLQNLGAQGEKAFLQVANSVMSAETAIKRSNKLLDSFWHSLKQTAKYQISAAMFQGVTSGIRSAFNYAEDLNKSLNNIQIVTGKSSEEMARFAQQANKAAKELSATTTEYTDAALIYYQQGDSDALATKKADITIKAANAAGSNAQEMSEYLTAVWNSYDVGEEKLMQYADVMAAIGAGTATSFEEISEAMEKVASVGEATGVKFEQLSSIIATVSSVTRQSASTVGTAFKTIFARMADLELDGKVVEDGVAVTLGDVSEQLEMVGVNVLDVDGNLRDMGTVMEELMVKWDTMNDATRQAVAIAVAGKRQYTQLLALMNNQDMYESSMSMAEGAEGTVDEQAEIYAKSWEASSERVRAATEGLWDSLLDDKWFIGLNDAFAEIIEFIEKLVDSMGGPIGVFSALGMVLTKVFNQQMVQSIANMTQHLYSMSAAGKQAAESLKMEVVNQANIMLDQSKSTGGYVSNEDAAIIETNKIRLNLQKDLMTNAKNMTQEQIQQYQNELDINKAYEERYIKASAILDQKEKELMTAQEEAETELIVNNLDMSDEDLQTWSGWFQEDVNKLKENAGELSTVMRDAFSGVDIDGADGFDNIVKTLDKVQVEGEDAKIALQELKDLASKGPKDEAYGKLASRIKDLTKSSSTARAEFIKQAQNYGISKEKAEKLAQAIYSISDAEKNVTRTGDAVKTHLEGIKTSAEAAKSGIQQFSKGVVGSFSSISSIAMGITSLKGAFDALSNPDMSTWEKVTSVMMSLGMGIPSLINGLTSLHSNWNKVSNGIHSAISATIQANIAQEATTTSQYKAAAAALANAQANGTEAEVKAAEIAVEEALQTSKVQSELLEKQNLATKLKVLIAQKLGIAVTAEETGVVFGDATAKTADTGATWLLKLAQDALNGSIGATVAILLIVVATVAIVVAAIYGLVKIVQAATDAYNADAIAAEKANQALKQQQEQLENAKSKHEELLTTLEKYNDAYDTLMGLTQGTQEWNEQVKTVNQTVTELLSKFPQLSQYMSMVNGVMTLSPEGQQQYIAQQEKVIKSEEQDVTLAQIRANETKVNENVTNWSRQQEGYHTATSDTYGYDVEDYLKQMTRDYAELGDAAFDNVDELGRGIKAYSNILGTNVDAIKELIISNSKILDTNEKLRLAFADSVLRDKEAYQKSSFKDVIASEYADKEKEITADQYRKEAETEIKNKDATNYFKALYGENYDPDKHKIEHWTGPKVTEYIREDDSSSWQSAHEGTGNGKNELYEEDMIDIIAQYKADQTKKDIFSNEEIGKLEEGYQDQAKKYTDDLGVSYQDAVQMVIDKNTTGTFDLSKLTDEGVQAVKNNVLKTGGTTGEPADEYSELDEQIYQREKYGDLTMAKNSSYRELMDYATSRRPQSAVDGRGAPLVDNTGQFIDEGEVNEYNESLLKTKEYAKEVKDYVAGLNEEEKKLFKDKVDFMVTTNKEGWDKILEDAKKANLKNALGDDAEKYGLRQEELAALADSFVELGEAGEEGYEAVADSAEAAEDAVVRYSRLNKAVLALSEDWETYDSVLKDVQRTSDKNAKALVASSEEAIALRKHLADLLGTSSEFVDVDLLDAIDPATFQAAASGSEAAIEKIRDAFIRLQIEGIDSVDFTGLKAELDNLAVGQVIDLDTTPLLTALIQAKMAAGATAEEIEALLSGFNIDADVTPLEADMVEAARLAQAAGEAIIENTSFTQSIDATTAEAQDSTEIPQYEEVYSTPEGGIKHTNMVMQTEGDEAKEVQTVHYPMTKHVKMLGSETTTETKTTTGMTVNTETGAGKSSNLPAVSIKNASKSVGNKVAPSTAKTAGSNVKSQLPKSSGGGGSSSKPKGSSGSSSKPKEEKKEEPKEPHEKSEKAKDNKVFRAKIAKQELDRFADEDAILSKLDKKIADVGRAKEETWGTDYLKAIEKENKLLKEQEKQLGKLEQQAKEYMAEDLAKAKELGLNIEVDEDGYITNREAIEKQIFDLSQSIERRKIEADNALNIEEDNRLNALLANTEANNKARDEVSKDIENKRKANEKAFEEEEYQLSVMQGWLDNYDESHEKYIEAQTQREEKLVQIRQNNLDIILTKTEKLIELNERELEVLDIMQSRLSDTLEDAPEMFDIISKKYQDITDQGNIYIDQLEEANEQYHKGEISYAGYIEAISDTFDGLKGQIDALLDYRDEMDEMFANGIDKFLENLDKARDGFDHLISLTENYENIMDLLGKKSDKTLLKGLYEQRQTVTKLAYETSVNDYQAILKQYQEVKAAYDSASAEEAKYYKEELDMLAEEVHSRQLSMLDNAQAWAESMNEIRDLALQSAAETLQKALFGDMSKDQFDEYVDSLRAKTEEYLTETNQQYETQKMIRTAMRDLEKTENEAAKRKLDNFRKETEELQKQSKLSNFELQVQQAKYDLLLAEIALQEAQDAKSTVRLRRDSEGNFNYIYTADQDKVAEAEQKYADAENSLYNLRLEGANEYAEKYTQTMQELADKIAAINEDMSLNDEEKRERIAALQEDYNNRMLTAQSIYNIAAEGLSDDLNEAWTTDMMENIASVSEFKTYTTKYIGECDEAFKAWKENTDTLSEQLASNYGDVEEAAKNVKGEVEKVRTQGLEDLSLLWAGTQQWARDTGAVLDTTIGKWQSLLEKIIEVMQLTSGFNTDINYMERYQTSTTVEEAYRNLLKRDRKVDMQPGQWEENIPELMKDINDQSLQIQNASTASEALAAAARREAKLAWIKEQDTDLYHELTTKYSKTEDLLWQIYKALGYEQYFDNDWQTILDGLAEIPELSKYNSENIVELIKDSGLTSFDTGGYTGDFGPEGGFAFLHEKELVLNKQDTENLLDTVDIVRDLIDSFEYNNLINSIAGLKPISIDSVGGGDFLEQEVTIHAEFPNVQDRHEIEDAIENLVLTASQFANRKS